MPYTGGRNRPSSDTSVTVVMAKLPVLIINPRGIAADEKNASKALMEECSKSVHFNPKLILVLDGSKTGRNYHLRRRGKRMKGGGNIEEYFLLFFPFEFAIFFSSHFSSASAVSQFPPFWAPPEELWVFRRSVGLQIRR